MCVVPTREVHKVSKVDTSERATEWPAARRCLEFYRMPRRSYEMHKHSPLEPLRILLSASGLSFPLDHSLPTFLTFTNVVLLPQDWFPYRYYKAHPPCREDQEHERLGFATKGQTNTSDPLGSRFKYDSSKPPSQFQTHSSEANVRKHLVTGLRGSLRGSLLD